MPVRGIRGATTVERDDQELILSATRELLAAMLAANPGCDPGDIASAWFTLTPDLVAVHPAKAAHQMGWESVPLMCAAEIAVPGSLPRCIRILLHWNTERTQSEIHPVYLNWAKVLRPDLFGEKI